MLLKRLDLPAHIAPLVPLLDSRGVRTTEQVLLTKRATLLNLLTSTHGTTEAHSPPPLDSAFLASALEELITLVAERVPFETGYTALQNLREEHDSPRTQGIFGLPGLDGLMGTDATCVLQVCGSKGVGKSLLALYATLRLLGADPAATARWVDTEGAFNASRAQAVLHVLGLDVSVLDRLTVSNLFRLEPELFDVLDQVRSEPSTKVLVVDNVASLFRDSLMGATAQGHAAMITAMNEIAELTYTKELLTIVTNSPASSVPTNPLSVFSTTTIKPSLGVSFSFETDIELLLQDTGRVFGLDQTERDRTSSARGCRVVAEVLKSRVSPSGTWTVFETDGTSLLDVLPPPLDDQVRIGGAQTGRPALGGLHETLTPAIAPLRERR